MIKLSAMVSTVLVLGTTWAGAQTLTPGVVTFRAHDPYRLGGPGFYTPMNQLLLANSFGRNWFDFQLIPDCPKLPCGVGCFDPVSQAIDYSMTCSPFATGWDLETVFHETGHLFGVGEGPAWDYSRNPPVLISEYGDPYDPEGSGGFGRHWNAFYKEVMGFLGESGLRPILLATNSGTFYISNAEDQSPGPKALKVLRNEYILYRDDGVVYMDAKEFYYLELRTNHVFMGGYSAPASPIGTASSSHNGNGKGKHNRPRSSVSPAVFSSSLNSVGPAVQARLGTPHYLREPNGRVPFEAFLVNIGNYGGLAAGASFADVQVVLSQITYFGETNYVSRPFSVNVISADNNGAEVQVNFQ